METWRSTEWEYFPLEWVYSLPFVLPSPPEHLVCESRPSQPVFMASTISWLDASSRGKEEEEEELGLRRKQRRSSFIFLCFASSLSRFLRRPHPWTEGSRIASRPLQLPVSVSISYFRQKNPKNPDFFWRLSLPALFPTHHTPTQSLGMSMECWHRALGPLLTWEDAAGTFSPCPGGEQFPFLHPNDFFFGPFIWTTLVLGLIWFWAFSVFKPLCGFWGPFLLEGPFVGVPFFGLFNPLFKTPVFWGWGLF